MRKSSLQPPADVHKQSDSVQRLRSRTANRVTGGKMRGHGYERAGVGYTREAELEVPRDSDGSKPLNGNALCARSG